MATFKKNLLEAFQDANDERHGVSPVSGGPFAGPVEDEIAPAPRPSVLPEVSLRDTRTVVVGAAVVLAVFVAGMAVGRWLGTPPAAVAAASSTPEVPSEPAAETAVVRAPEVVAGEAANAALLDPRNTYSILAVTYGAEASDQDLAYATYHHFAGLGLPVAYPLSSEGRIYVLVGAAATKDELIALRDRVRTARDPDGREGEYAEAYVVNLDAAHLR